MGERGVRKKRGGEGDEKVWGEYLGTWEVGIERNLKESIEARLLVCLKEILV